MTRYLSFNFWVFLVIAALVVTGGYLYVESYQRQSEITTELLVVERNLNAINDVYADVQQILRDKRGYQYSGNEYFLGIIDSTRANLTHNIVLLDKDLPFIVGLDERRSWTNALDSVIATVNFQLDLVELLGVEGAKTSILNDEPNFVHVNQNFDSVHNALTNLLVSESFSKEAAYKQYQRQNFYGFLLLFGSSFMLVGLGTYLSQKHLKQEAKIERDNVQLNILHEQEIVTKAERDRLEFVLEGTKAGLWEWNVQTGETVFDERWAALIGYTLSEISPVSIETWVHFTHPDDLALAKERLDACFRRETDLYQCEFRMRHKNGHLVWILDRGSVKSWTNDGKPLLMFGTHIDVSEVKNQALSMAEKERIYRGIFNSTYQFMALLDPDGRIVEMNDSGLKLTAMEPEQIVGCVLWECGCWIDDGITRIAVKECIEQSQHGKVAQIEVKILDAIDKEKTILFNAKPILDENGELESIIVEGRPIQDIVDARQALIRKNEELDMFASVASHDMKEPLRMVASFMQLLEKNYNDKLDDKARQYIHFAVDGAKRMTNLINELLAYARVNRDMRNLEDVDLNDVVKEVLALLREVIKDKGSTITVEPLPMVRGYPVALRTLFTNLVSNGIKYQPEDRQATIRISSVENEDSWLIHVEDNGIGIAEEYHEEIFKLFKRLHTSDQYPGTGLGLSTCKRIIDEHGGTISVVSAENSGSTFSILLPKRIIHDTLEKV
jgi:PAS domain S-box-containing protein